jgi:hypothetical protein
MHTILFILDWSELWAPLLSLIILLFYPRQPKFLKPIIVYLIGAVIFSLFGDIIAEAKREHYDLPHWLQTNLYLYNLHSIVRFICFAAFFNAILKPYSNIRKWLAILAGVFLLANFIFFEDFFNFWTFSSRLLSVEAGLLLLFCLQYYIIKLNEEETTTKRTPDFWVVTGLCIYVVVNFFIFLFYTTLAAGPYKRFLLSIWNVHNISYIVLCILLAKAFYDPARS